MGICRDVFYRQIGAKIAYYRTLHGWEQNQLAEKVHISQSTLSRIERGKYGDNISIALLLDIAEGLDIDPSLLTTFSSMEKSMWA
ncbi:helix-turn-helix domain-containing protein [Selenomonas sp. KH1T6]|uniref:helix-turn-helix domain-containing protein n=1 Tax=Selenomonas sp. KH1T6 TaxID=3158784 RepID=UPI0008A77586|nr:Helix-turn-helix [Selenomonas ruminantium]